MKVKLVNKPTLEFVDSAIGKCWGKGSYGADTQKGVERIDRVCNKRKHGSMLRFVHYIFDMQISTSVLLELSRHQAGVDLAIQSTRYTVHNSHLEIDYSGDYEVDVFLDKQAEEARDFIYDHKNLSNDSLKLILPQAYLYNGQVQFNAQSLQHFFAMRAVKGAHPHIRQFAHLLYASLPEDHKFLFDASLFEEQA